MILIPNRFITNNYGIYFHILRNKQTSTLQQTTDFCVSGMIFGKYYKAVADTLYKQFGLSYCSGPTERLS